MLVFVAARTTMMKRAIHAAIQSLDVTFIDAATRAEIGIYYVSSFDELREFNASSPGELPKILLAPDPYFTQIVSVQLAATICIKVPFLSSRLRRAVFESLGLPYRVEEAYENANRPLPIISKKQPDKRSKKVPILPASNSELVQPNQALGQKDNVVTAVGMPTTTPNARRRVPIGIPTMAAPPEKKVVDGKDVRSMPVKTAVRTVSGMPAVPRVPARPEAKIDELGRAPTEPLTQGRAMASKEQQQSAVEPRSTHEYDTGFSNTLLRYKTDADLPVVSSLPFNGNDKSKGEHLETVESMAIQYGELERVVENYLRPHIEKVVWSVVPRLAERLIRDEIEKVVGSSSGERKSDAPK